MTQFRYLIAGLIACLIQGYALSFAPQEKVLQVSMNQGHQGMQIQLMASTASNPETKPEPIPPVQTSKRNSEITLQKKSSVAATHSEVPKSEITKRSKAKSNQSTPPPKRAKDSTQITNSNVKIKPKPTQPPTQVEQKQKGQEPKQEKKRVQAITEKTKPKQQPEKSESEAANTSESVTISNQSSQPMLVNKPRFSAKPTPVEYPRLARKKGLEGRALIEVWLDKDGKQIKQKLIQSSGHEILDSRALNTIKQWQFSRQTANGQAIAHRVQIPINFKLK